MSEMEATATEPADAGAAVDAEAVARSDALKAEGNELLAGGKYVQAAEKYSEALTITPESAILYSNRAMLYTKMESYGLAIADAEEAIAVDPSYLKVRRCARTFRACGRRGPINCVV